VRKGFIAIIGIYRKLISPYFIRSCRFVPTCSEYAQQAIETYGVIRGSIKTIWRILRCNPFSRGGYDPVIKEEKRKS
jgi:uncharacterized protein